MINQKTNKFIPDKRYDVVIVGAGIVGAGLFREFSFHGLKTLLIDKHDFCSQTSASSSKMLHGGIRYLENLDFALVKEALHEKMLMVDLAPHLNYHKDFYLPVYKDSIRSPLEISAGISLYDFLAKKPFRSPKWLTAKSLCNKIPTLEKKHLLGAGVYNDAIMDDRKLGLDLILEAAKLSNAKAINHLELETFNRTDPHNIDVKLQDNIMNKSHEVSTKHLVIATGPFTDNVMHRILGEKWQSIILASKGSHIYLKNTLELISPVVITPKDGRVIFIIPREGNRLLVGTTEVKAPENFEKAQISAEEINYLCDNFNLYFPKHQVTKKNVIGGFSGIRPLISEGHLGLGKTARDHKIYAPFNNLTCIAGGKYTTFRLMAQEVSKMLLPSFKLAYNENHSMRDIPKMSKYYQLEETLYSPEKDSLIIENEYVRTLGDFYNRIGISDFWQTVKPSKENIQDIEKLI